MKKTTAFRVIFYVSGLLILALGIILNTKSFVLYTIFVLIEMILHTIRNRKELNVEGKALESAVRKSLPLVLGMDLLQLPLSLVFTRFMNLFSAWIPAPSHGFASQLLVLAGGIICTGIGAAMSLGLRFWL